MADKSTTNNPTSPSSQPLQGNFNTARVPPSPHLIAQFTASNTTYKPQSQTTASTQSQSPVTQQTTTAQNSQSGATIKGTKYTAPQPQLFDLKTYKGCKFIIMDPFIIDLADHYEEVSGTFQWEVFQDQADRCVEYIRKDSANKRTFLVSSGGLGKEVVPKIHNLPQVYAIYIYCSDVQFHQEWTKNFPKVHTVCNDDKYLLTQLAIDVAQCNIDWGNALLQEGNRAAAKEKFQKAVDNLTMPRCSEIMDSNTVSQIRRKIEECK